MTISAQSPVPHLAIIMSVYFRDEPAHLRESLESIVSQSVSGTHQVRIYLAIDGPVSPQIDKVISEYKSEIHRIFRLADNRGLAAALNVLISSLEDEAFIFRMDADDISLSDRFEKQLAYMERNPDVDILGGAILEFGDTLPGTNLVLYPQTDSEARRQIAYRSPVAHPTVCFRRRVFDTVGTYPEISGNEDIALWFDCLKAGLVFANLPDPVLRFRVSPGFWTRRGFHKSKSELGCYLKGLNAIEGLSIRMAIPVLRFLFRLTPEPIRKLGYGLRGKQGG
jgi:glycosyltransferase involved in cell wall biosynthesis